MGAPIKLLPRHSYVHASGDGHTDVREGMRCSFMIIRNSPRNSLLKIKKCAN
jgi:hypothetical protein